ncbi:SufD family Fe-S cluster assembly protein, partial [Candidatus Babeliales bacterium]|nr:SufD family Fe-S cluster assembly protein [Candidatus Babeliales bacterium]
ESINARTNKIECILEESSRLHYQLFVANHHLCETCKRKELYDCQQVPQKFEKELSIKLTQPNAQAFIKCHYLGDDESEFKLTTTQHHQASETESFLVIKGVLDNQAKLVSDNIIIVDKKLTGVLAKQENKNLMLNKNARVISIPKLKINSQKVSCSHGATVSPLDPDALFYLQSRGVGSCEAEQMLVEAFLGWG